MKKPLSLREETWDFLQRNAINPSQIRKIIQNENYFGFGPMLFQSGIAHHANLLENSVIEMYDECEYIITPEAALDLALGKEKIALHRLGDEPYMFFVFDREEVIEAIKNGPTFDQL